MSAPYKPYPDVPSNPDFAALEQEILRYWEQDGTFEASVDARASRNATGEDNEYVFYDGPPFANGLPHHGHLLTGFVKDLFPRYHTMKGQRVERRFGWDCHGLPAEMEAEKELKISGRKKIMDYGIRNFNEFCRTSVMKYAAEWEWYVNRQARWVDFQNDYKTMDTPFMESVIWAFSELNKKGLIYEGFKVMPYSWSAETVLSSSEIRLDDATREKEDKAITVAFKLKKRPEGAPDAAEYHVLAWTTTPWTLPSNLALAVSPEMDYIPLVKNNVCYLLATSAYKSYARELMPAAGDETRRCVLRPFMPEDAELLVSLHSNPQVAQTTHDGVQTREEILEQLDAYQKHQKEHGYSQWAVFNKQSGAFMGRAGLTFRQLDPKAPPTMEVRCALLPEYWDSGYGTELCGHWVSIGFNWFTADKIVAGLHPENPRSRTMQERLGFTKLKDVEYRPGFFGTIMSITREEFEQKHNIPGNKLVGLGYEPLFPYLNDTPNAFRILAGDFIEEGSGTGVVHLAPGFGEDDQRVCAANDIPTLVPVDGEGRFTPAIYDLPCVTFHPDRSIETARCVLRVPAAEDEHYFITLHTNAQVMETMNDGVMTLEQAKADFAANLAHFQEHGYGQWLVFDKKNGAFMGRAGLSFLAQSPEMPAAPTLRCGLLPDFWHGGYGSELCQASLVYGFNQRKMERIVAGAHGDNPRAHRMLKRLGLTLEKEVMFKRVRGPYYAQSRDEFLTKNPPLSLKGLNVIKETKGKSEAEPYTDAQLEKYGLANLRIINWLKLRGRLIRQDDYKHNYPHCWRTDQPIIYRAMSSWFVDVPKIRDRMVELNQQINWIPGHVKDGRFGKWIENAREWSISRSRFWGCPIPVWRSDNPNNKELHVFGSIAELKEFFGKDVTDLHRPYIDELTKPDPLDAQYTIRRVEEVFDCWFESGSMPYAQVHYPFENKEWFETHFPADFIVEYEAQTRGWFYNMYVLAVGLFDRIPFKNCICHGVVLDDKGRKLSKRLKNYMDPKLLFEKYGSDALRWFMMSSSIMRGSELLLDPEGKFIHDAIRLYIKPIWNAYNFFTLYANADGVRGELLYCHSGESRNLSLPSDEMDPGLRRGDSLSLFDRYILAKCRDMVQVVEKALDDYDTPNATQAISEFVEVLNNWYIRRNKERFWKTEHDADKQAAYDTLYTVLHILCRTAAPLLPMVTEKVWLGLTASSSRDLIAGSQATHSVALDPAIKSRDDGGNSVHLASWPDVSMIADEAELIAGMDRVRDICNTALSIRSDAKIRVRQPLASMKIIGDLDKLVLITNTDRVFQFTDIIADEVNISRGGFAFSGDANELKMNADYKLKLNNQILGKRLPEKMKQIIPASKKGEWEMKDGQLHVCGEVLLPEEYELNLEPKPGIKGAAAVSTNDALVVLDLTITPELEAEGKARDIVRMIQQARKDADLNVSDRIKLMIDLPASAVSVLDSHGEYIAEQTLALSIGKGTAEKSAHTSTAELDGETVTIGLSVAA